MADVFGLSDVAASDTGRGGSENLKTGGIRRKYNMKKMKCKVNQVYDMKLKRCVAKKSKKGSM